MAVRKIEGIVDDGNSRWWIIDERADRIDTIPLNATNVEDAVWEGKIKWFGLTDWEKEQRISFSVAFAPVDEDGFCDLDDITEEYPFKQNDRNREESMAVRKINNRKPVNEGYSVESMAKEVCDLSEKSKDAVVELWMDYIEISGYLNGATKYADTFSMAESGDDYEHVKELFADVVKGIKEIRKILIDKLNK